LGDRLAALGRQEISVLSMSRCPQLTQYYGSYVVGRCVPQCLKWLANHAFSMLAG
jgi:hypothetical protein